MCRYLTIKGVSEKGIGRLRLFVRQAEREEKERERERGAAAAAKVTLQIYAHMREIYLCDACAALFTIRN